jgi:hypothetical protein
MFAPVIDSNRRNQNNQPIKYSPQKEFLHTLSRPLGLNMIPKNQIIIRTLSPQNQIIQRGILSHQKSVG